MEEELGRPYSKLSRRSLGKRMGQDEHMGLYRDRMMKCKPIETVECTKKLAYDCKPLCEEKVPACATTPACGVATTGCSYWVWYLVWFFIIAIIVWFILYATKPTWVQTTNERGEHTGQVDNGKVLVAAIVIALIILLIFWIFRWACGDSYLSATY